MEQPLTLADYRDYQPTVEDLLHIQEFWNECAAVQAHQARAQQIAETDTRDYSPAPSSFPVWEAQAAPLHDAIRSALETA